MKPEPEESDKEELVKPETEVTDTADADKEQIILRMIEKSPESARIILFSSSSFLSDTSLDLGSAAMRTRYLAPVQLIANTIDWSLEDRGLLSIRARGHFSRPLAPMDKSNRMFWEYLNYALALSGVAIVFFIRIFFRKKAIERHQNILKQHLGRA